MARVASGPRPAVQLPEPERCWIRYAPRRWQAAPEGVDAWLDPAAARLGPSGRRGGTGGAPELPRGPFDDVLWVPPVTPEAAAARDQRLAEIVAEGTPVLAHLLPGDPPPPEGTIPLLDPLPALLAGRPAVLERAPAAAVAVWTLLGGLTDGEAVVEEGLARLAAAGVGAVQVVAPDLPPGDRRLLAQGRDEKAFDALFHGPPADPRAFARRVRAHGLDPFPPRPLPREPLGGAPEREAAGLLLLAGELEQRLGRHGRGQAHFRAARWLDRSGKDPRALARDGNLPVLPWLDPPSRRIVEEWAAAGRSECLDDLVEEYLA